MPSLARIWQRMRSRLSRSGIRNTVPPLPEMLSITRRLPKASDNNPQSQSIFFTLPAELRIMVYERVFTLPRTEVHGMVELAEAAKQLISCAPLIACRVLKDEASEYLQAYKRDWEAATFSISNPQHPNLLQQLETLPVGAINTITHIRILATGLGSGYGVDLRSHKAVGHGCGRGIKPFGAPWEPHLHLEELRARAQYHLDFSEAVLDMFSDLWRSAQGADLRMRQLRTFVVSFHMRRGV